MHLNDTLWLKFVHRNTHSRIINENHIQKQKFTESYGNYDNALQKEKKQEFPENIFQKPFQPATT